MHRFYVPEIGEKNELEISQPRLVKQLAAVLRLQKGDKIVLFDGDGMEHVAVVTSIGKKNVGMKIETSRNGIVFKKDFTLYCAILKKENFELVVQKAVELGVSKIVPIVTRHCVKKDLNEKQFLRLREVIREAVEQSEGAVIPEIMPMINFSDAVTMKDTPSRVRAIASERDGKESVLNYRGVHAIDLFIGPEGGFTQDELNLALSHGIISVTLGKRILRAETAAIAAVSAILLP